MADFEFPLPPPQQEPLSPSEVLRQLGISMLKSKMGLGNPAMANEPAFRDYNANLAIPNAKLDTQMTAAPSRFGLHAAYPWKAGLLGEQ